jgi:hypothetical protein
MQRREFLSGLAVSLLPNRLFNVAQAQEAIAPTAATSRLLLTVTEQLMYSAVRISSQMETGQTRWGTGFLFRFFNTNESHVPAIVTNRHVVDGMKHCALTFAGTLADGNPDLVNHVPITMTEFERLWMAHPSADLAIIPVGAILNGLVQNGTRPFLVGLDQSLIPTDSELKELTPVEQVLTVGFPGQVWDDVHNLPVFHRGYTATAPYIDFKGKKEFLIDFATWPGASGSPVLLYNDSPWINRSGTTSLGGVRTKLLGVVYGVAQHDVQGNVRIQAGPTSVIAAGQMSVPTNLGACISSSRILEFEPLMVSKGLNPPADYKMRAN